jgi:hypothetical protein
MRAKADRLTTTIKRPWFPSSSSVDVSYPSPDTPLAVTANSVARPT